MVIAIQTLRSTASQMPSFGDSDRIRMECMSALSVVSLVCCVWCVLCEHMTVHIRPLLMPVWALIPKWIAANIHILTISGHIRAHPPTTDVFARCSAANPQNSIRYSMKFTFMWAMNDWRNVSAFWKPIRRQFIIHLQCVAKLIVQIVCILWLSVCDGYEYISSRLMFCFDWHKRSDGSISALKLHWEHWEPQLFSAVLLSENNCLIIQEYSHLLSGSEFWTNALRKVLNGISNKWQLWWFWCNVLIRKTLHYSCVWLNLKFKYKFG